MRYVKWIGIAAGFLLIVSCFTPWVFIESKKIVLFTFVQKIWAKRLNLFVTAINMGWAVRNFFIIAACQGGECPEKKSGIYFMLLASILMLISSLFPDMKLPDEKGKL